MAWLPGQTVLTPVPSPRLCHRRLKSEGRFPTDDFHETALHLPNFPHSQLFKLAESFPVEFLRLWLHSAFRSQANGFLKMCTEEVEGVGPTGDQPLSSLLLPPEHHPRPPGATVVQTCTFNPGRSSDCGSLKSDAHTGATRSLQIRSSLFNELLLEKGQEQQCN